MEKKKAQGPLAIDTGVIYALADQSDSWHAPCARFVETNREKLIVSCAVVPEACYLLNRYLGAAAETAFLRSLSFGEIFLDHFPDEDLSRCVELMEKYKSLNLGFVDASVVAMCERRKIHDILTIDRKHFSVVRPKTDQAFQLFP